jgi:hypothetical protein
VIVNKRDTKGWTAIHEFYSMAYKGIPVFDITESKTTAFNPEFVALELVCEGEPAVDLPNLGMHAGDKMVMTGVTLFWWRWEGPGEEWDGSLSDEAVRGWKIIEERLYINTKKKEV